MEMVHADAPAELGMPVGEAMFSQRAIRRFRHDKPIPGAHVRVLLEAAAKAPSGGNAQPARFLVLEDRERIRAFGKLYHEAWWAKRRDDHGWSGPADLPPGSFYRWPALLADEMVDAPLVILAFTTGADSGHSVYPGVQNLLLAARALGIGSVLTTLHPTVMDRVYALLEVPAEVRFHCCIPLGYPRGDFGPTRRYPTSYTTHWNKWGSPPPW